VSLYAGEQSGQMKNFVLILFVLGLSGCATTQKNLMYLKTSGNSVLLQNKAVARDILLSHYNEWKGTKYKYGGSGKDGIDCSGFVYQTFLSKFGIQLPRKSIIQGKVGVNISVSSLQPGDLVFFKTGFATRHVGIYIDNNEFMHVSENLGVTRSSLNEPYWSKRYWKARRITM
jgi:cell wall-associated NlpC family hydrolase